MVNMHAFIDFCTSLNLVSWLLLWFVYRSLFFLLLFLKRFIAQKIQRDTQGYKIVPLTNLPQLSFAEREIDYLPCWVCISVAVKNKYKGKNTAVVG